MTWLPVAVFSLLNGLAFLVQATPAVQRLMAPTIPVASLDQVITYGLASATLVSLLWLARPFTWRNRASLLLVFAGAALCAISQHVLRDASSSCFG